MQKKRPEKASGPMKALIGIVKKKNAEWKISLAPPCINLKNSKNKHWKNWKNLDGWQKLLKIILNDQYREQVYLKIDRSDQ